VSWFMDANPESYKSMLLWTSQQPGFISCVNTTPNATSITNTIIFDTFENMQSMFINIRSLQSWHDMHSYNQTNNIIITDTDMDHMQVR